MKKLFIVESPAKANTIKKYLNDDFIVTSTMGHIKDLPQKKLGIIIEPPKLEIEYETMPGKDKIIKAIKKYLEESDEIYLAPDADREGEIIAYHIKQIIDQEKKYKEKKVYRVTYNEISKSAILESIQKKRPLDSNMVAAQQGRRILDRLVGYKVSPVLWRKIAKGLSAGRVQSVALKLICKREEEINKFIIEEYWTVHGILINDKKQIIVDITKENDKKATLTEKEAEKITEQAKQNTWKILEIKDKEKKRKPLAPFVTSTLQQSSYNILHYNVQQTMLISQELYEGVLLDTEDPVALITYMRTDSTRISDSACQEVRSYISNTFGNNYLSTKKNIYTSKDSAQDAHEAIRPINVSLTPEIVKNKLKKEQYKLYELIWNRYVACQMKDALYSTRSILLEDEKKELSGKISGSTILFDGFLKIYDTKEDEEDEKKLPPNLTVNSTVKFTDVIKKQHFTQPPSRYSEATLVKELEQKSIGRPSTYVPILRTIRDRLYTELDSKKRFIPTALGSQVYLILEENMTKIMDYSFTANMEKQLDQVAAGELTRESLVFDFYNYLMPTVENFLGKKIEKKHTPTNLTCPEGECGHNLVIKWGKSGEFLGCSNFPDCKFTANFTKNEQQEIIIETKKQDNPEFLDIDCIKCQKKMMKKIGRYGEFIACSGYPTCSYIKQETTVALCPLCKKNPLNKRIWKGKIFWGCSGYPTCKFAISGDIIEKKCNECGYDFFKKSNEELVCANKDCPKKNKEE